MKKLIWLAVDSNGDEKLTSNSEGFQRFSPIKYHHGSFEESKAEHQKVISYEDTIQDHDIWIEYHNPKDVDKTGKMPCWNFLPKGTIKKIIGKELTWNDEPIKIEEQL